MQEFFFENNKLRTLPPEIGNLKYLRVLNFYGNDYIFNIMSLGSRELIHYLKRVYRIRENAKACILLSSHLIEILSVNHLKDPEALAVDELILKKILRKTIFDLFYNDEKV